MEKLTYSNLCPGPGNDTAGKYWYCDGIYCPIHCDPDVCRPAVEARGYTLCYTEKHYARQRQLAETAAASSAKS